ncbi:hypothetical protein BASA60_004338 [Batrachochytrium salamandrivorans]|nr:hypothetical protein BASA60_004338 [Batrachochytrium salamandrivorans]
MVAVSLFLVLALVSSTVVAQPGTKSLAEAMTYLHRVMSLENPTKSAYEWIPPSDEPIAPISDEDSVKIGLSYILERLDLKPNKFRVRTSFTDHLGITHVYGVPLYLGLPIDKLHAAAHVKNGQVFFCSATIKSNPSLTKISPTTPEPIIKKSSEEALRDDPITQWIQVKVDANTGHIVSMEDFKREFTYTAIELPKENPHNEFNKIVNPENFQSSPNGWTEGYKLKGNNALIKFRRGMKFQTTTRGVFDMDFDPTLPPQTPKNLVAGAINAFYVTNMVHDTLYQYGFTEPAGNFQMDNFGKGGKGGDPIILDIQNSKKKNNAYFYSPPDGQSGVLTLHIYTATEPNRDSAMDNTILAHELAHGLSTRLTGGARITRCMAETESLGLGEGYSDVMALIFTAKPEDTRNTRKVVGEYVEGSPTGIRRYTYTTDMRVNPLTYKDAVGEKERHRLGEIWAIMLWEVYWSLVEAHGFSANLHDATQKEGNIVFLQILVGTLMIQPCNPTFNSAYDAMLAADYAYYGGIHKHLIIKGFAKRGLGSIS